MNKEVLDKYYDLLESTLSKFHLHIFPWSSSTRVCSVDDGSNNDGGRRVSKRASSRGHPV